MLSALFASGHIIDLILAAVCLEATALLLYRRRSGAGLAFADLLPNLLAGACLLLAVRCALIGLAWVWIAAPLAASLVFHLIDLRRRWRPRPASRA